MSGAVFALIPLLTWRSLSVIDAYAALHGRHVVHGDVATRHIVHATPSGAYYLPHEWSHLSARQRARGMYPDIRLLDMEAACVVESPEDRLVVRERTVIRSMLAK